MEGILAGLLERIRNECSRFSFGGRTRALRTALDETIAAVRGAADAPPEAERGEPDRASDPVLAPTRSADPYFHVLKLGCDSGSPRIMDASLGAIQVLVSHGFLRGTTRVKGRPPGPPGPPGPTESPEPPESPESPESREAPEPPEPPESPDSPESPESPDAREAAAAAATEEAGDGDTRPLMDLIIETICDCKASTDEQVQRQVVYALVTAVTCHFCEVHEGSLLAALSSCYHVHLHTKSQAVRQYAKDALSEMVRTVFQRMEDFDLRMEEDSERAGSEEGGGTQADADGAADGAGAPARGDALYEEVFESLGFASGGEAPAALCGAGGDLPAGQTFPSVLHKDGFWMFRAICRLSMRGLPGDAATGTALQTQILSLELILQVLRESGPAFRGSDKFVSGIREHLCVALLKNCTSAETSIVGVSLRIFIQLMIHFKDRLKKEVEVFVANIFLRVLESEHTSFEHKQLVVAEGISVLCRDAVAMTEIFLNYDCDISAIDLFRRIVAALAKIAKTSTQLSDLPNHQRRTPAEDLGLRKMALEGLLSILRSLCESGSLYYADILDDAAPEDGAAAPRAAAPSPTPPGARAAGGEGEEEGAEEGPRRRGSGSAPSEGNGGAGDEKETDSVVESFGRKRRIQDELQNGIVRFNMKPKKGLQYLSQVGHVRLEPASIAQFLHAHCDRLDKTMIGDFLGNTREYMDGLAFETLNAYVADMDFKGLHIDEAIRIFLAGFRLPGEAQKIDRMMEKFAEQYFLQNSGVLPSADTAFVLSFSIIMLQTDLHNPSIKEDRRMTKEDFIRNNRGINNGEDVAQDLLSGIYDRILRTPISLKEDDEARLKEARGGLGLAPEILNPFAVSAQDRRRREALEREREDMLRFGEAVLKTQKASEGGGSRYLSATDVLPEEHLVPMFEVVWGPALGCFSHLLSTGSEATLIDLVLRGFRLCVRFAGGYELTVARSTLMNALAKFTTLDTVTQMKPKHIECIKAIIEIAIRDGDRLHDSWERVLRCLSQVARLQLFASGAHTDDAFFSADQDALIHSGGAAGDGNALRRLERFFSGTMAADGASKSQTPQPRVRGHRRRKSGMKDGRSPAIGGGASISSLFGQSRAAAARAVEASNAEQLSSALDDFLLDRVYAHSVKLDATAIREFVDALCLVSRDEIATRSKAGGMASLRGSEAAADMKQPRVFSLQKLVEVADCNMDSRPRIVWGAIWRTLTAHFEHVGLQDNSHLAMFTVDSLRQLSTKFLSKDELSHFSFQRLFLAPFETIMANSRHAQTRELVLVCLQNMTMSKVQHIASGWSVILSTCQRGATDPAPSNRELTYQVVDRLLRRHLDLLNRHFTGVVECLLAFSRCDSSHLATSAFDHFRALAAALASGDVRPSEQLPRASPHRAAAAPDADADADDASTSNGSGAPFAAAEPSVWDTLQDLGAAGAAGRAPAEGEDGGAAGAGEPRAERRQLFLLWGGLLRGVLERVGLEYRDDVRGAALSCARDLLVAHGDAFPPDVWRGIFAEILFFPLKPGIAMDLDEPQAWVPAPHLEAAPQEARGWVASTSARLLLLAMEALARHAHRTDALLLSGHVLSALRTCLFAAPANERLARVGCRAARLYLRQLPALARLAPADAKQIRLQATSWIAARLREAVPPEEQWTRARDLCDALRAAAAGAEASTPYGAGTVLQRREDGTCEVQLSFGTLYCAAAALGPPPARPRGLEARLRGDARQLCTRLVVCLHCARMAGDALRGDRRGLDDAQLHDLLGALRHAARAARSFMDDAPLRAALARSGVLAASPGELPTLVHLEVAALGAAVDALLSICGGAPPPRRAERHPRREELVAALGEGGALGAWLLSDSAAPPPGPEDAAAVVGDVFSAAREREEEDGAGGGAARGGAFDGALVELCGHVVSLFVRVSATRIEAWGDLARRQPAAAKADGAGGGADLAAATARYRGLEHEVQRLQPVVARVVRGLAALPDAQFARSLGWVYPLLCDLVVVDDLRTRELVQRVLMERVRGCLAPPE